MGNNTDNFLTLWIKENKENSKVVAQEMFILSLEEEIYKLEKDKKKAKNIVSEINKIEPQLRILSDIFMEFNKKISIHTDDLVK